MPIVGVTQSGIDQARAKAKIGSNWLNMPCSRLLGMILLKAVYNEMIPPAQGCSIGKNATFYDSDIIGRLLVY